MYAEISRIVIAALGRDTVEEGEAVVRRSHDLSDAVAGEILDALEVDGDHASGVALLTLTGPSLSGRAVAGMRFTIGAATHTVAADAQAENGQLVVQLASALGAPVADGAAASISQPYGETRWKAFCPRTLIAEGQGDHSERILQGAHLHLAIGDNAGVQISPGSVCSFNGKAYRVQAADLVGNGRWVLMLGEAA